MAVVAPLAKYKKTNYKIWILILFVAGVWFAYDGYKNDKFIAKHTKNGVEDHTLVFHKKAPPFLIAGAIAVGIYAFIVNGKKIVADEQELILADGEKIPYSSLESINKTDYASKGCFVITYKGPDGKPLEKKICSKNWDNMDAVLDLLVSKISG
ncbi:MAG: hypothetical protein A2Y10_12095 [Planctomycetes bacterium GWF2_41_51]|nr:MAG: hypothetical protein A2Y10_12095 [Planctomycetes bacterium GWF2_41_51]HBG28687.1 hypothetical protein [Phycisphaerales bacterium]